MKIIIDAMGGDNAPLEIVKGAIQGHKDFGAEIILTGKENEILKAVEDCGERLPDGVTIRNCTEVIEAEDDPGFACRRKKDSSMTVGLTMLRDGEGDAFVSAGSTGALLAGATLFVKRVRGIRRAAMSPLIPTAAGDAVLVDCGANIECTPEYLLQFAYIGNFYAKHALKLEHPRVGLLNIGAEESKGMQLHKDAYILLKEAGDAGHINFIGNVEAKDALKGSVDVIVADGFSGNIMLKTIEGTGSIVKTKLKGMFMKNLVTKIGALCVKGGINDIKLSLDPNERGATPFLGIAKPVLKAHGSSNARAIRNAVKAAMDAVDSRLEEEIASNIELMQVKSEKKEETLAHE